MLKESHRFEIANPSAVLLACCMPFESQPPEPMTMHPTGHPVTSVQASAWKRILDVVQRPELPRSLFTYNTATLLRLLHLLRLFLLG